MPRNISFFHTQKQIVNQTKTVTRRLGWKFLKTGDTLNAVEKAQGLKKGEKINKLCQIVVTHVTFEPLNAITQEDCIKEGFPEMTPSEFIDFFCKAMKCEPDTVVTRIEFRYVMFMLGCVKCGNYETPHVDDDGYAFCEEHKPTESSRYIDTNKVSEFMKSKGYEFKPNYGADGSWIHPGILHKPHNKEPRYVSLDKSVDLYIKHINGGG